MGNGGLISANRCCRKLLVLRLSERAGPARHSAARARTAQEQSGSLCKATQNCVLVKEVPKSISQPALIEFR